jgi:hypothetical protein
MANVLINLWLASCKDSTADELAAAYDIPLKLVTGASPPWARKESDDTCERLRYLVLRQLAADRRRLPRSWLESVVTRLQGAAKYLDDPRGAALLSIDQETISALMEPSDNESPEAPKPQPPGDSNGASAAQDFD